MLNRISAGIIFVALMSLFSNGAHAATFTCASSPPDVTGNVSPNDGCEYSDELGPDQPSLSEINAEEFFGVSNWNEEGKVDTQESTLINITNSNLNIQGDNSVGSWEILNFDPSKTYMLLFKDGNKAKPGILVGYLVSMASGTYDEVYSNKPEAISNIQLLSTNIAPIPLPGAAWLMLTGLAGFLGWRRRAKIKASA